MRIVEYSLLISKKSRLFVTSNSSSHQERRSLHERKVRFKISSSKFNKNDSKISRLGTGKLQMRSPSDLKKSNNTSCCFEFFFQALSFLLLNILQQSNWSLFNHFLSLQNKAFNFKLFTISIAYLLQAELENLTDFFNDLDLLCSIE